MSVIQKVVLNSLVALAYFVGGVVGALLASEPSNSSPVWPAAGIALAVILVYGKRVLPGLFVGVFCAQVYVSFDTLSLSVISEALVLTTIKSIASCAQALIGVSLVKRFVGLQDGLLDLSKILFFFFYGAVLSCMVAPTICISLFYAQGIIAASDYLLAWATWWTGDMIGVFIFTPILLAFLAQPASVWRPRRHTVASPLLVLLVLLVCLFAYTKLQEVERINTLFEHSVERVEDALESELNAHKHVADYIKGAFDASVEVTEDEFKILTQASLRHHPDLIAIEWIPRVLDNPLLPWSLNNKAHFPIKYVEPYLGNERAVGFDIAQNKTALQTVQKVIRTGESLSTGLIHLVQDKQQHRATSVVYAPVYKKNASLETVASRELAVTGVIAVVFSIEDEKTEALSALVDNQLRIQIRNNEAVFYSNFTSADMLDTVSFVSLYAIKTIDAGGNQWEVSFRPSESFLSSQRSWHVWWTLLGGLILTGFVGIGLLVLTGRTAHIAEQVEIKTQDLSHINSQLNQEIALREQLEAEQLSRNVILESLAKGDAFKSILTEIVESVERLEPQSICSILLLGETGKHLKLGAAVNLPDFYNEAVDGIEIGVGVGSCGTAAYMAEQVIVEDIMTHPYWAPYKELAKAAQLAACWSEPVISSKGKVLGTFAIYYREPKTPTEENLAFIKRIADLTAITIERKQAEDELRIAATTFQSHDAVVITDVEGTILRVNQAYTDISGYSAEEVLGKNPGILHSDRHNEGFYQKMYAELVSKGRWEGEIWNRRKNGEPFPERMTITAVYDGAEITHYVGIFSDISDKKASEAAIQKLAFYDPLTALPNRRLLLDRLEQSILGAKRHKNFGALIFLDLDRFKTLNDTLGHQVGDELLIQVAKRIKSVIREEDTACRLGGDEFVVLIFETDSSLKSAIEHAAFVAEKIRDKISQPFDLAEVKQLFSASIGVSVFPDLVEKPEEILEQADTAMYRSKQMGRNTVSFYSSQMQEEHNRKASLERMLHKALSQQEFVVYYQGQMNSEGDLISAEALLRWVHPEQGMVSPAEFIPIAEDSHLIVDIGGWVLHDVCQQIKDWQQAGLYLEHVAVNISPRQFRQEDFVLQVTAAVTNSGIEAKYLMLELTEGIVIDNIKDTIGKMLQIQAMGIAISIDDFGTGYSSLTYLKQLPLSQLKIDQSFVRDIQIDASDEVIVEAIIALAHKLDLEVIAEGVETREQLRFLQTKGCEKYQGYYFCRPMPAKELFLSDRGSVYNIKSIG